MTNYVRFTLSIGYTTTWALGSSQLVVLSKRSRIETVTLDTLFGVVADEAVHFPTLTIKK